VTVTGTTTITPTTSGGGSKTTSSASSSVSQVQTSGGEREVVGGLWSGIFAVLVGLL